MPAADDCPVCDQRDVMTIRYLLTYSGGSRRISKEGAGDHESVIWTILAIVRVGGHNMPPPPFQSYSSVEGVISEGRLIVCVYMG